MNPYIPLPSLYVHQNDIPPRLQWNANYGYCGEVSMISAGLYYGQYLSQYDVRAIASPHRHQDDENAQLLLGKSENAGKAASRLRLSHVALESEDSEAFLAWVKKHVAQGHPVIIGVLNNVTLLGEKPPGDSVYDHIVPVIGFGSEKPLSKGKYRPDDVILFSDNGLYTPGNSTPYYQQFKMVPGEKAAAYPFLGGRARANKASGNIYTLLELPKHQVKNPKKDKRKNYAMAITGVEDRNGETLPVRVTTNLNYEQPAMKNKSNTRPDPMPLELTVTVSGLEPGVSYNLYRYSDENEVPTEDFNKDRDTDKLFRTIEIESGSSWSTELKIQSSDKVFFRAVRAS